MDTYPITEVTYESGVTADSGADTEVTAGGTLRTRQLYAQTVYDIRLHHDYLTQQQADALQSFYEAHKAADFLVSWPFGISGPETYQARFLKPPQITRARGSLYFSAVSELAGIKQ